MTEQPLMQFDSHIAGKNAQVNVFPDRIEWGKSGWMSTGAKAALGVATAGMSLLATGVRGSKQEEVIFVRSISSVTSKKSGLTKQEVSVITPGGTIGFRCTSKEASEFKTLLLQLVAGGGQSVLTPTLSGASTAPADEVMVQLQKLGELKAAGILSEEEFHAKKADLLGRL